MMMKTKVILLVITVICLSIGYFIYHINRDNGKENSRACQKVSDINSVNEVLLPISCPVGKMFVDNIVGYSNLNGEIVLADEDWTNASYFYDNQFAIVTNKEYLDGIINKKGRYILDYEYYNINYLGENAYFLKKDIDGKVHYYFGTYSEGLMNITEVMYKYIYDFSEGLAAAILKDQDKIGFINRKGEVIIPFIYDRHPHLSHQFHNDKVVVSMNGHMGVINRDNEIVIPFIYDYIEQDSTDDEFIEFCENGMWGLMNNQYQEVLKPIYKAMGKASEHIVAVSINQEDFAFIDLRSQELITDYLYKKVDGEHFIDNYNYFNHNYSVVTKDQETFNLITKDGKEVFTEDYLGIKVMSETEILVKYAEELYYLYDLDAEEIIEFTGHDIITYPGFSLISICNEYYEDGAYLYQLYDLSGQEIIPGLKIYDYMTGVKIGNQSYLAFNGEINNKHFSSFLDENLRIIWQP